MGDNSTLTGVPVSGAREIFLWLVRRRWRFRVTGYSMMPALNPSDEVLVDGRAYRRALPHPGDIVVTRHPYRRDVLLVKRVAAVLEGGRCQLTGDNPAESTDSRSFGAVPSERILGRVTSRLPS